MTKRTGQEPSRLWYDQVVKSTVYIETSVVSYYVGRLSRQLVVAAHQQLTRDWWETELPGFEPYVSTTVLEEISRGDPKQIGKRLEACQGFAILQVNPDVEELASVYADAIELPSDAIADAMHLALASMNGMDYLVSWNCRHIVSARVRRVFRHINDSRNIESPIVCTPEELHHV